MKAISGGLIGHFNNRGTIDDLVAPFAGFSAPTIGTPSAFSLLRFVSTHPECIGRLEFMAGDESLEFAVGDGKIWGSTSSTQSSDESIIAVIKEERSVRSNMLRECAEESDKSGKPLIRTLFENGHLDKNQLVHTMSKTHLNFVDALLTKDEGDFFFNHARSLEEVSDGLAVPCRLLPHLSKRVREELKGYYHQDLEVYLGSFRHGWLTLQDGVDSLIEQFRLHAREEHVVELLRLRSATLMSFARASILGESNAARFLVYFLVFDLLQTTDEAPVDPDEKTPLEAATAFLQNMTDMDLFEQVGGHFTSHSHELAKSFNDVKQRYGPSSPASSDPELQNVASQIWSQVVDAWEIISEKDQRMTYRNDTFDEPQRRSASELLFRQGKMAIFRGQIEVGRRLFQAAAEIFSNPDYDEAAANPMKEQQ